MILKIYSKIPYKRNIFKVCKIFPGPKQLVHVFLLQPHCQIVEPIVAPSVQKSTHPVCRHPDADISNLTFSNNVSINLFRRNTLPHANANIELAYQQACSQNQCLTGC